MPRRLIAVLLLALLLVVAAGGWALNLARERAALAHGQALFRGEAALAGRIVGHGVALPTGASRCINCHETRGRASSAAATAVAGPTPGAAQGAEAAASGAAGRYGPALDRETLAQPRPRRGGPPSRYDAAAFCALLRTGVDPAQVMIPQAMPRYEIGDADCEALWRYLLSR